MKSRWAYNIILPRGGVLHLGYEARAHICGGKERAYFQKFMEVYEVKHSLVFHDLVQTHILPEFFFCLKEQ